MSRITCNHCGREIDADSRYCPSCNTPTPAQREEDLARVKRKFILFVIGLAIFCAGMIVWLPRAFR